MKVAKKQQTRFGKNARVLLFCPSDTYNYMQGSLQVLVRFCQGEHMKRRWSIPMAALALVATVGALPIPKDPNTKSPSRTKISYPKNTPYQVGSASWYGKRFHGRTTASGEDFDMFEMTAAHRSLRLGSVVKVD